MTTKNSKAKTKTMRRSENITTTLTTNENTTEAEKLGAQHDRFPSTNSPNIKYPGSSRRKRNKSHNFLLAATAAAASSCIFQHNGSCPILGCSAAVSSSSTKQSLSPHVIPLSSSATINSDIVIRTTIQEGRGNSVAAESGPSSNSTHRRQRKGGFFKADAPSHEWLSSPSSPHPPSLVEPHADGNTVAAASSTFAQSGTSVRGGSASSFSASTTSDSVGIVTSEDDAATHAAPPLPTNAETAISVPDESDSEKRTPDKQEIKNNNDDPPSLTTTSRKAKDPLTTRRKTRSAPPRSTSSHALSIYSVQGHRPYMEDETYTNASGSFAAVMDGHGGSAVARYVRQNLYARYLQSLSSAPSVGVGRGGEERSAVPTGVERCRSALRTAFETVDREVQRVSHWSYQGTTAVAAMVLRSSEDGDNVSSEDHDTDADSGQGGGRYLITANVGDSRAVLSRSGRAIDVTVDHKPNVAEERERIEKLGGSVDWCGPVDSNGEPVIHSRRTDLEEDGKWWRARGRRGGGVYRINGNLSLSRAIGDRSERPCVSSEVDVREWKLDVGDEGGGGKDEFVLLGSDGLWDVFVDSQEVITFCHGVLGDDDYNDHDGENKKRRMDLARIVVEEAFRRGSMDNISAVIIWLH